MTRTPGIASFADVPLYGETQTAGTRDAKPP